MHSCLAFEVFHHRPVTTMYLFVLIMPAGIVNAPTVKNKSTSISTCILRYSLFVREATDVHYEWRFFIGLNWCKTFNHLSVYTKCQYPVEFRHNNTHTI